MENYLSILKVSLVKKEKLLIDLIDLSQKQFEIVKKEDVDWDDFNELVDSKSEKIDEIMKLDEGFDILYNNIKENLINDKNKYASEIKNIQILIRSVTEKSSILEVTEKRNKTIIESAFVKTRNDIKQTKLGQKVAISYYNKMNQINTIDPQLMDKNC